MTTTLDSAKSATNITLSGGNLTATNTLTNTSGNMVLTTTSHSTGMYYFELTVVAHVSGTSTQAVGLANASQSFATAHFLGESGNNSIGLFESNQRYLNGSLTQGFLGNWSADPFVIGVAVDLTTRKLWATCQTSGGSPWNNDFITNQNPVGAVGGFDISAITGALFVAVEVDINTSSVTLNLGASAFTLTPPAGYGNWDASVDNRVVFGVPQDDGRTTVQMIGY